MVISPSKNITSIINQFTVLKLRKKIGNNELIKNLNNKVKTAWKIIKNNFNRVDKHWKNNFSKKSSEENVQLTQSIYKLIYQ